MKEKRKDKMKDNDKDRKPMKKMTEEENITPLKKIERRSKRLLLSAKKEKKRSKKKDDKHMQKSSSSGTEYDSYGEEDGESRTEGEESEEEEESLTESGETPNNQTNTEEHQEEDQEKDNERITDKDENTHTDEELNTRTKETQNEMTARELVTPMNSPNISVIADTPSPKTQRTTAKNITKSPLDIIEMSIDSGYTTTNDLFTELLTDIQVMIDNRKGGGAIKNNILKLQDQWIKQNETCKRLLESTKTKLSTYKNNTQETSRIDTLKTQTEERNITDEIIKVIEAKLPEILKPIITEAQKSRKQPEDYTTLNSPRRPPVIIKPKDHSSVENVQRMLYSATLKSTIQPSNLKVIEQQDQLKIVPKNNETHETLIKILENTEELQTATEVTVQKTPKKNVVFLQIPNYIQEENIAEEISNALNINKQHVTIKHRYTSNKPEHIHWVVQLPINYANELLQRGRLTAFYRRIRIVPHRQVLRCFRCQQYNHRIESCTSDTPSCANCALAHNTRDCTNLRVTCVNCVRAANLQNDHRASEGCCPEYQKQRKALEETPFQQRQTTTQPPNRIHHKPQEKQNTDEWQQVTNRRQRPDPPANKHANNINLKHLQEVRLGTPEGSAKILHYEEFMTQEEAKQLQDLINAKVPWTRRNGMPRDTAYYGSTSYKYSNTEHQAELIPTQLQNLKRRVENKLKEAGIQVTFNSVLLNKYRNGRDYIGWHSDDEPELGRYPIIASVSLGQTRNFDIKSKYNDEQYRFKLHNASLLAMTGSTQRHYRHSIPQDSTTGERINLTFRCLKN